MEDQKPDAGSGSWSKRLAILFGVLFAIFWSLGPFFFWTPLLLSIYFAFLAFYNSRVLSDWLSGARSSFGQPASSNTYQPPRQATAAGPAQDSVRLIAMGFKVFKWLMIGIAGITILLFFIGLFAGEESPQQEETIQVNDSETEDGTTMWNEKGNAALANERYDSGIYYYDKALAIDKENVYALYNKGLAYTLKQDYRRANAIVRQCVRLHPDYNPAWWLLGYNYDLTSNTDSAVYFLEKAYLNDYGQPEFLQLMAEVYLKKGRRQNALEAYGKLVTMDTTRADVFLKMAELDPSNADDYRRKAKALKDN